MGTPASCFSPPCDSLPTAVPCLRGGGSQCRAMGQPEPWGCRQPGSSRGDGNIQVCPAWSRERAVTDHAAPRHFSLHLHEAAAAENRARGGISDPGGLGAGTAGELACHLQEQRAWSMLEAAGWFCQVPPSQREKALPRSGLLDGSEGAGGDDGQPRAGSPQKAAPGKGLTCSGAKMRSRSPSAGADPARSLRLTARKLGAVNLLH